MPKSLCPSGRKAIRFIATASLFAGLLSTVSLAQTIVWTDIDARKIQRKDVSGGEIQTIAQFQAPQAAYQLSYDPIAAKLYYRISGGGSFFQRANLDGSEPETIPTPTTGNFTVNVESRMLYWINAASIYRSELNGAGATSHTYANCCPVGLVALGDDLYFGAGGGMEKGIWRADADGTNEQLLHTSGPPMGVAHDPIENKLYWIAFGQGIHRMNTDGTDFEQVVFVQSGPERIAVDYRGRKMYWQNPEARVIQRANLDGSNVEEFVTASEVGNPNLELRGLTIAYNSAPIPALSGWGILATAALTLGSGLIVLRKQSRVQ